MAVYKVPGSPYWQIRFRISGRTTKQSSGSRDKRQAQELERQLRDAEWRRVKLGERRWTWDEAVARFTEEKRSQAGWRRQERCLAVLGEYFSGELLSSIDYEALLTLRTSLSQRTSEGHQWKTRKTWKRSTVNRVLAVAGAVLHRAASDEWKRMIDRAPTIPLYKASKKTEPRWITREQAQVLLTHLAPHTADMVVFALATGLRRDNVTGMEWSRIDTQRRCCYVPGYESKTGEPIPIPLNADAMALLERRKGRHPQYVFEYRGRAPLTRIVDDSWRRACKEAGLEGITFHTMRHSWASWQTQAGTPILMLQKLGGWANLAMPQRYSHLDPGQLADYADRVLLDPEKGRDGVRESAHSTEDQQEQTPEPRK